MKTENIRKLIEKQFKTEYWGFIINDFQRSKFFNLNSQCFNDFFNYCAEDDEDNKNSNIARAWLEINDGNDYNPYGDDDELFSESYYLDIESHVSFIMTFLKYIKSNESVIFMLHGHDNENYEVHLMTVTAESISFRELK